ncbi:hypothetical protein FF021_13050 [Leptospira noguchii]|nr:hypothetical protein FF021_13050 [Leptospira noguchii]
MFSENEDSDYSKIFSRRLLLLGRINRILELDCFNNLNVLALLQNAVNPIFARHFLITVIFS